MIGDLSGLYWRIRRALGRGRVIAQDDSGPVQLVQLRLTDLETFDKVPRLAEYGLTSVPPDGSDGVAVFFSGDRSSGVVIATGNQQYRVKGLAKGEVCVYDNQGQTIRLKVGGGIVMTDKSGSIVAMNGDRTGSVTFANGFTVNANTQINGTLTTSGNITTPDVSINGVGSVKNHNHTDPQGGVVGAMQN